MDIPPQYPHQPPRTLQADVQAAGAVTDIEPDIVASAVLVAHQAELNGGRIMVDRASAIGAALQDNARHEGWGGFVEVVVCLIWCIGIVADAPGWAVGSRQSVGCTPQRGLLMLPSHSPLFPFDVWWDCQGESEAHR